VHRDLISAIVVGMRRAQQSVMRILAIAFALSLVGCVDETLEEGQENVSDDTDPSNPDQTGDLPNDNKCTGGNVPGGGVDNFDRRGGVGDTLSRKKADGGCY
jgi:hypothetical protein